MGPSSDTTTVMRGLKGVRLMIDQDRGPRNEGVLPVEIAVVGCGYVGLVTAVGYAEQGMRVRAYDVDPRRVAACRTIEFPMVEPGLREAARKAGGRLTFHDIAEESWPQADFTFIAVPTPQGDAGYPNLSMLRQALTWISSSWMRASGDNVIVIRSTVPPGTARWAQVELERLLGAGVPWSPIQSSCRRVEPSRTSARRPGLHRLGRP